ncbi:ATP-binding protein [Streptomyces sp. NPDC096205]|uniref:ATP-binding protein n=1 Tax=Streptomyces sp. NPDC096205 TaxID=3366081 RepID=UPI003819134E
MHSYDITESQLRCVVPFRAAPAEVRLLRAAAARQLAMWGMPAAADEAGLLVTELATNVVKHVGEGSSATLVLERRGERVRFEVHDQSRVMPLLRAAECGDECGRGLHLITSLAVDWGTVLTAVGKAVWCEVDALDAGACLRIERAVAVLEGYQGSRGTAELCGMGREAALDQSVVELIADLLHWGAARGHDPDDILDRAQMHYEAEADAA